MKKEYLWAVLGGLAVVLFSPFIGGLTGEYHMLPEFEGIESYPRPYNSLPFRLAFTWNHLIRNDSFTAYLPLRLLWSMWPFLALIRCHRCCVRLFKVSRKLLPVPFFVALVLSLVMFSVEWGIKFFLSGQMYDLDTIYACNFLAPIISFLCGALTLLSVGLCRMAIRKLRRVNRRRTLLY